MPCAFVLKHTPALRKSKGMRLSNGAKDNTVSGCVNSMQTEWFSQGRNQRYQRLEQREWAHHRHKAKMEENTGQTGKKVPE